MQSIRQNRVVFSFTYYIFFHTSIQYGNILQSKVNVCNSHFYYDRCLKQSCIIYCVSVSTLVYMLFTIFYHCANAQCCQKLTTHTAVAVAATSVPVPMSRLDRLFSAATPACTRIYNYHLNGSGRCSKMIFI